MLAYYELCRVFWKMGGSRLDAWSHEVQAGSVPSFGPNLHTERSNNFGARVFQLSTCLGRRREVRTPT